LEDAEQVREMDTEHVAPDLCNEGFDNFRLFGVAEASVWAVAHPQKECETKINSRQLELTAVPAVSAAAAASNGVPVCIANIKIQPNIRLSTIRIHSSNCIITDS
jgi:hypothetical protein